MIEHESTGSRLRARLAEVVEGMARLAATLPVRRFDRDNGDVVFICPEYYWGDVSPEQRALQMELKRSYEPISELLRLLLTGAPDNLVRQLEDADQQFRVWLEL